MKGNYVMWIECIIVRDRFLEVVVFELKFKGWIIVN